MKQILLWFSLSLLCNLTISAQPVNHSHTPAKTGNGNNSLGQSYLAQNLCGMNFVQASVQTTTRYTLTVGTGFPTVLTIAGLPSGFTVQQAYLYYGASYTEATPPASAAIVTNPAATISTLASALIGTSGPVCWGETGTASYRTDVTSTISGNGAYTVNLTGFANAASEVDGVTLFIIYVDPSATYSGNISIWDGDISDTLAQGINTTEYGITPCTASVNASGFGIYGDMESDLNGNVNTETFNGTTQSFSNNFWQCNVISPTANLTSCQDSVTYDSYTNNSGTGDCFFIAALGIYWQFSSCSACSSLIYTTSHINPACGVNNGSATITLTGGTIPYTYLWMPGGQTNASATGLSAGIYSVTVHDAGCNVITTTDTLLVPAGLTLKDTINGIIKCNGDTTGSVSVSVNGGVSPYTYSWSKPGRTNSIASDLSAGTYTVVVKDSNGCTDSSTVSLTQPTALTATADSTAAICVSSNGSASISVSGGTSPYTYSWSPVGLTSAGISGLSAGTYTVFVSDSNGCTLQRAITVKDTALTIALILSDTNVSCFGSNNGSASVSASGGISPYTYSWLPSGGTTAHASGLTIGTYTIMVTDSNGCSGSSSVSITQPAQIVISFSVTPSNCSDSVGIIMAAVNGGTSPYTYSWGPGGQTTATITGLSAGTYSLSVTDSNGCSQTGTANVTSVSSIVISLNTISKITCNGASNGSDTAIVSGGTSPYTYLWNPGGSTNASESGLSAGNYTITVTDAKSCVDIDTFSITQPAVLKDSLLFLTNITCHGLNNGTVGLSVKGGTNPYTYSWSPSGGTSSSASNLSAGTYTVYISDSNGCAVTYSVVISNPPALSGSVSSVSAGCVNNNGSATIAATGGTGAYTYSWIPSGETKSTATGLSGGLYSITVTDNNGCTFVDTITVFITPGPTLSISGTNILCNGTNSGLASVSASGGTTPYTYSWSNGKTTASISGLSAGTYIIKLTDAGGCSITSSITLTQPANPLTDSASSTGANCSGTDGSATAYASGGTSPYTYSWSPGTGTSVTISGLSIGTYSVFVMDANGCTASAKTTVSNNSGLTGSIISIVNIACFGNYTGSATVGASGGTSPYTYFWNPSVETTQTANGLSAGTYTVSITDANGCSFSTSATLTQPATAINATSNTTSPTCNNPNSGGISLLVSGGTSPYTYSWSNGSTTQNLTNISAGTYSVSITDLNGCTFTLSATVSPGIDVIAYAGRDTVLCQTSSATFVLNGSGSTGATSYQWFRNPGMILIGDTSIIIVVPLSGTNTYVLVAYNGSCSDTSRINVTSSSLLFANAGADQTIFGNGTAALGGNPTGPIDASYYWSPSSSVNDSTLSNPIASPSVTTVYTVLVRNSAGCVASDTVTISVNSGIIVPSGFSPNGDGVNDVWLLPFDYLFPDIYVEVYNRWGELLFHSSGYKTPWDGTYNGKPVPVGTYYYIINPNNPNYPKAYTGTVTIVR